jgi:hypothetical protein
MDGDLAEIEWLTCPGCDHVHIVDQSGYIWGDCEWARQENFAHDDGPDGLASLIALVDWYWTIGPGAEPEEA